VPVDLAAAREGIDAFWAAWPELRRELDLAVAEHDTERMQQLLHEYVDAIHPELAWEHAKGLSASDALVVSAEGSRELRSTAERWLRAAPEPDAVWEFHSAWQPDPGGLEYNLALNDVSLALPETTVTYEVDSERGYIDVTIHHPALPRLDDSSRTTFAFLFLDWLLGEDGVERWIGTVESSVQPDAAAGAPAQLVAAVEELSLASMDLGWNLLEAETEAGLPVVAVALAQLKPIDYPLFDLHVAVELPYLDQNDGRLPVEGSAQALSAFEDELEELLGEDGLVVAHDAVNGVRTIHVYGDAESSIADTATVLAATWPEGEATVTATLDPAWDAVAHLRA